MAEQPLRHHDLRFLRRFAPFVGVVAAIVLVGWPSTPVDANEGLRTLGLTTLTFDADGAGDEQPARYRVDAIVSSQSSRYGNGVLCRVELTSVFRNRRPVLILDIDLDRLQRESATSVESESVTFGYREMGVGAEILFEANSIVGNVELLGARPAGHSGNRLHLLFDAVVQDERSGEERFLTDAEIVVVSSSSRVGGDGLDWYYEGGVDYVDVAYAYQVADCAGDPLYDDGWERYDDEAWWEGDTDYWSDDSGDDTWADESSSCDGGDDWDSGDGDYASCDSGSDDDLDDWEGGDCDDAEASVVPTRQAGLRFRNTLPLIVAFFWLLFLRSKRNQGCE